MEMFNEMFDVMPDPISQEELKEALSKFAIPAEDIKPFAVGTDYWFYHYDEEAGVWRLPKRFENNKEFIFGDLVLGSKHEYHIIAGKTRASVEARINGENGFLKLFPFAKYYPNGDKRIKIPHIKFNDKIIFVCGHSNRRSWEVLRGMMLGVSMVYDLDSCNRDFYIELQKRTHDLSMDA